MSSAPSEASEPSATWLPGLLRLLERRTGLVLGIRGLAQLEDTFAQLLRGANQSGPQLLAHLNSENESDAWSALLEAVTVPETHFYRVLPQMLALEREILPELLLRQFHQNNPSRSLRIWSAGCSSGEEAYTLAILLEEAAARLGVPQQAHSAKVLGTDLSPQALRLALRGSYGKWSFRGTPAVWREKYFHRLDPHGPDPHPLDPHPPDPHGPDPHPLEIQPFKVPQWEVLQRLRSRVEFGLYNLVEPPAAQELGYDLIVCRNVTLYFRSQVAQAVYRHLTSRLSAGGYLLLGPSDPPPLPSSELEQKSAPGAFYWQKIAGAPRKVQAPLEFSAPAEPFRPAPPRAMPAAPALPGPQHAAPENTAPEYTAPEHTASPVSPILSSLPTLLEQGLERLERGEAAAALELLRKVAYADPDNAFTHFLLGRTWLALNRPVRARAALLHAQSLLANTPPETPLASAPDLSALDLRHALERLLLTLDPPNSR